MEEMIGGRWVAWKELPETQEFVVRMITAMQDNKDNWAEGAFLSGSQHETLANNMVAMGETRAYQKLLAAISEIRMTKDTKDEE